MTATANVIMPMGCILGSLNLQLNYFHTFSVQAGIYSQNMQMDKAGALPKSGDVNNLSNYRPLFILPIYSTGLEKITLFPTRRFFIDSTCYPIHNLVFPRNDQHK